MRECGGMAEHERRPRVPTRTPETPPETDGRGRMKMPRPRFIVIVLALLAINYVSVALLGPGRHPSIDVAYNPTFLEQVQAGNVKRISARGETVEGEFKKAVKPPEDPKGDAAKNFQTEVPTFANTDELSKLLEEHSVIVQAKPINSGSLLTNLILGFGPVLLLVGLFVFLARRAGGGARGLGGPSTVPRAPRGRWCRRPGRARRVLALARPAGGGRRPADHVRRRGRHRRGQGGADGDRRLPQEPRALPAPGRADPARRAAVRPARHRQDAAGQGGGGGGERAVLLNLRVGVRGGDRRHRRVARARPVQDRQGVLAGDHLHRRARRDRALALPERRLRRRQRRARADAQPDPDRDGRLRVRRRGDRARRHQPPRDPRQRAAAPRALRPPRRGAAARQGRPPPDPRGPHALAAAG